MFTNWLAKYTHIKIWLYQDEDYSHIYDIHNPVDIRFNRYLLSCRLGLRQIGDLGIIAKNNLIVGPTITEASSFIENLETATDMPKA